MGSTVGCRARWAPPSHRSVAGVRVENARKQRYHGTGRMVAPLTRLSHDERLLEQTGSLFAVKHVLSIFNTFLLAGVNRIAFNCYCLL